MSSNCEQHYVDEPETINDESFDEPIRATPLEELTYLAPLLDNDVNRLAEINSEQANKVSDALFFTIQSVASFNHSVISVMKQDTDHHLNRKYFADIWKDRFDTFNCFLKEYIPEEIRKNKLDSEDYYPDIELITKYVNIIRTRLYKWYEE